jgi:hypothetical protein
MGSADPPGGRGRLTPGGRVTYFMTGPEGDKHAGYLADHGRRRADELLLRDGLADLDFNLMPATRVSKNVFTFTRTTAALAQHL